MAGFGSKILHNRKLQGTRRSLILAPMNDPFTSLLYVAAAIYLLYLIRADYQLYRQTGEARGFPGVTPASRNLLLFAAAGGIVLTMVETVGESVLGLTAEQTTLAWFALGPILAAAVIEEVVFRGYLFFDQHGPWVLWGCIFGFSLLFALIHPYLWNWEGGFRLDFWNALTLDLSLKGWFSTLFVFISSLFFYLLRFCFGNKQRSLFPCIVAHATANASVYCVKMAQGFVEF